MCGIAGIVRFDQPGAASRETLRAMQKRLAHRGPNGRGEFLGEHAALAHTRLAMLDATGGAQPLTSADGRYTLVYNGELYDHTALRAELPGPWRTDSDTETVLEAWRAWGEAAVDRLDGMYAFFVWDSLAQVGHAVRDRLGVKPLAFTRSRGGLAFASEAQALAPVLGAMRANEEAIVEYLVAAPFSGVARSPFAGVEYLLPGHVLRVSREGITTRRAWRWDPAPAQEDPAALASALRDALHGAVKAAVRSDAPLGIFLSGGLDSTAIAALAPSGLPAFTITFGEQAHWEAQGRSRIVISDDTPHARRAASELGVPLHEVPFERASLASELAAIARVDDALPAWEQELSQRALARAASQHVKGVLVGDAADETHYGYHFLLDEHATSTPDAIVGRFGSVPVRRSVDPDPFTRLDAEYREIAGDGTPIARTTRLIVERWLPRLLHNGDIQCMAFGLEARVPFAASSMLALAQRVTPEQALAGGVEKRVLREALRGVVPESIRTRRKSALPKDQGAADRYREQALGVLLEPHPVVRSIVDLEPMLYLRRSPGRLTENECTMLFRVICLHHWAVAHEVRV